MNIETLQEFPDISSIAFQHPLDIQATTNLQQVPLLAPLLKLVSSTVFERQMRLMSISNTVRLGPNQAGSVYEKFTKAATILDIPKLPELYVSNQYIVNAYAYGLETYQITLYSGLIDALSEDELLAVIAHELGHVKCEHMLYKTIVYVLRTFGLEYFKRLLPVGSEAIILLPLQLAILHWERMAELSCDRAALLVVQDPEIVAGALGKLAGGSQKILPEINLDDILVQAQEYEDFESTILEQIIKVNMMLMQTHPFPAVRVKEILEWGESEQYKNILVGNYVRMSASPTTIVAEGVGKVCPHCDHLAGVNEAICLACGQGLQGARRVCANCRTKVFKGWQTCPKCGVSLSMTADDVRAMA